MSKLFWNIESHCCSACFGRVLSRPDAETKTNIYRCSSCGVQRNGHSASVLCCCGFLLKGRVRMGLKCTVNDHPTPEFPAEILALQI